MHESDPFPILGIDTSGPYLQVGLGFAGDRFDILSEELPKGHAEALFGRLQNLLDRNGITYADLGRLATTVGPGSFTGLRIGIAAARGLGLALDLPVIGVPNLVALSLGRPGRDFSILVDARRNQMYAQRFQAAGLPAGSPELLEQDGRTMLIQPKIDLGRLLTFAATVDRSDFPPDPLYVRAADAKPQTRNLIARAEADT
ncbi:MAG: tRNA (adenosine(37)-N6)-threonylcarbamoyltransferase complex dimerization subunit type 1 TsaB [Hyphomicrobiaceae bacterium]|nr:tRNA (adenosine(37)-N6)-threonylcarbamoyltransferase complex dimerization subunit type 1 TsaB [Hyphomicrobiaceae bacterium]